MNSVNINRLPSTGTYCQRPLPDKGYPFRYHMVMEPFERLKAARIEARYATATLAARALGLSYSTYSAHENGDKGFLRQAPRYARFFRVSLEWLLTGSGSMVPRAVHHSLPVMGKVGAGAIVDMPDDPAGGEEIGEVQVMIDGDFMLEIEGTSQWPRYLPGEHVIVQAQSMLPDRLIGEYAVVQVLGDGRRLLKLLRRGRKTGTFRLESHNAGPEDDVELLAAWRVKGVWYG